jgi:hypothetical protein
MLPQGDGEGLLRGGGIGSTGTDELTHGAGSGGMTHSAHGGEGFYMPPYALASDDSGLDANDSSLRLSSDSLTADPHASPAVDQLAQHDRSATSKGEPPAQGDVAAIGMSEPLVEHDVSAIGKTEPLIQHDLSAIGKAKPATEPFHSKSGQHDPSAESGQSPIVKHDLPENHEHQALPEDIPRTDLPWV